MSNFLISKSARLRGTPFTKQIEDHGVKAYTVYNHMLLPTVFISPEEDCAHLKEHVQVWDVSVERQVQIKGEDAYQLVQLITCRDLSEAKYGICYYAPIIDERGCMINDPIIMKVEDNTWWLSIADTDVLLYAKGLAIGLKLKVEITEPNVCPLAIQGPKSFALMARLFGSDILEMKFFHFKKYTYQNHQFIIARSGWSKQGGFEIYVDNAELGQSLYDELFQLGKDLNVRPGCPNLIERIEGGLLSYGNDITMDDTPLECGLEKFVSFNEKINYLGKDHLLKQKNDGLKKSITGIKINLDAISITKHEPLFMNGIKIGELRSATYSPEFNSCIGFAMIETQYLKMGEKINLSLQGSEISGVFSPLPFHK